jgi:RNA polymerase sigma-70 factor (ECF subfamily)
MDQPTESPFDEQDGEDERLVRNVQTAAEGDLRAFEQLVGRHQRRIVADCRHMTRDQNNAEDLAQEVFVKAFFGLRGFEGRSSFRHWLQRIKVNHCLNHLKKQQGAQPVSIEEESVEDFDGLHVPATAERDFAAMNERHRIATVLDSLPSTLRLPLVMRDMDELSYEEIAHALNIGLSAAKMRVKRAREEFRSRYEAAERTARRRTTV